MTKRLFRRLISIERKIFILALLQNHRGRYVRITEVNPTMKMAIAIPVSELAVVEEILYKMARAAEYLPDPTPDRDGWGDDSGTAELVAYGDEAR